MTYIDAATQAAVEEAGVLTVESDCPPEMTLSPALAPNARSNGQSSADVFVLDHCVPRRSAGGKTLRPIRVVVADPVRLVRAGLRALLEGERDIAVAGEAASAEEVVAVASETHPDVLLMDVCLPRLEAPEATRRIAADPRLSDINVLIVAGSERDDELLACLRAGASGCLLRDTEPGDLVRSVRAVAAGEPVLTRGVVRRLLAELSSRPDPGLPAPEQLDELTAREREVMGLVATGLSNDEIAEHLVISRATAKTHVSRALRKLDARDRAQLVTLAYETGLVLPRQPVVEGSGAQAPKPSVHPLADFRRAHG